MTRSQDQPGWGAKYGTTASVVVAVVLSTALWYLWEVTTSNREAQQFIFAANNGIDEDQALEEAYSLWLQPPEDMSDKLRKEIKYLAQLYKGPLHEPHITLGDGGFYLQGRESVLNKAKELAATLTPFNVSILNITTKPYNASRRWPGGIRIEWVLSKELKSAGELQLEMFKMPKKAYKPHLALLYDYTSESAKRSAGDGSAYRLLHTSAKASKLPRTSFIADRLTVWYTPLREHWLSAEDMQNTVGKWKKVGEYKFGKS